jgi:hypothetical protein
MRMRWERVIALTFLTAAASMPVLATASPVPSVPDRVPTIINSDIRQMVDRAIGNQRPAGATYANRRGEIVSPHTVGVSGVPRVHFTLLGSNFIASAINKRLRGLFGQHDATKTSRLTPTNQR